MYPFLCFACQSPEGPGAKGPIRIALQSVLIAALCLLRLGIPGMSCPMHWYGFGHKAQWKHRTYRTLAL